jgi:hypothetical protein
MAKRALVARKVGGSYHLFVAMKTVTIAGRVQEVFGLVVVHRLLPALVGRSRLMSG